MLRPVPMTRALIVGPRNDLEAIVEELYALKVLHIVDHKEGEEDLAIGKPLETAAEASEVLVKLRSIASVLQIKETEAEGVEPVIGDVRQKILALELNISEEDAAKKKTQALIGELQQKIDAITPLALLPLSSGTTADTRPWKSLLAAFRTTSKGSRPSLCSTRRSRLRGTLRSSSSRTRLRRCGSTSPNVASRSSRCLRGKAIRTRSSRTC